MTHLLLLATAISATGPLKIDGAALTGTDLVTNGAVTLQPNMVSIRGGRVELSPARQKALDGKLAPAGTVILSLVDNSTFDTTALVFGAMRLMRKLDAWYMVNTTGGQWRQLNLGPTSKGATLKLAIVEDGTQAHIFANGKDLGLTPYDASASQTLSLGSPSSETTPWSGDIKDFDVLGKQLTADDLKTRFKDASPNAPSTPNTPSAPAAEITKQAVLTAELVNLTAVPDPKSIVPYRHALVVEEYKVISVSKGHLEKANVGDTIRVARWGVLGGQKTNVADLKKGDRVELTLEKFSDHPSLQNFYTLNDLQDNFDLPYLLDVSTAAPGG